jgi:phenylacetate-CoA ligase
VFSAVFEHARDSRLSDVIATIEKFEALTYDQKRAIQRQRSGAILRFARAHVPYYRDLKLSGPEDELSSYPVLTKDIIRREGDRLVSDDASTRGAEWNTSGGTTGEPVRLLQCADYRLWSRAYSQQFIRRASGMSAPQTLWLWGSERDILRGSDTFTKRAYRWLKGWQMVNTFVFTAAKMAQVADLMQRNPPELVEAYVQSLYEFCRYADARGMVFDFPIGLMVSAGTLYDFMEDLIRKVFPQARLVNRYGSRETGAIAASDGWHKPLGIAMLSYAVEVAGDDGKSKADGEDGAIFMTSLANHAMPLIRYRIGDVGVLQRGAKFLGRETDVIERLKGRTVDVFEDRQGNLIDGEYFTHLFYFRESIRKFQVTQLTLEEIEIKVVPADAGLDPGEVAEIENGIAAVMQDTQVSWELCDEIPPDASGKFRFTRSIVRQKQEQAK